MSSFFWFLLLLAVTGAHSECPHDCICSHIETDHTPHHIHAKCTTLNDVTNQYVHNLDIHSLDLSSNSLQSVPIQINFLENLTHLDLSKNHLSTLTKLNNRIRSIDLSHNRLTTPELVNLPPKVRILNLSFNAITNLPLEIMNFKNLKSINLIGNHIHCSCETLTVRDWLHRNNVWMHKHTICATPLEHRHQPWDKIDRSKACLSETHMDNENTIHHDNLDLSDFIAEEFLPFDSHKILKRQVQDYDNLNDEAEGSGLNQDIGSGEGSGSSHIYNVNSGEIEPMDVYDEEEEEESDGSGSGAGMILLSGNVEPSHSTQEPEPEEDDDEEIPADKFKFNPLHIYGADRDNATVGQTEVEEPVQKVEQKGAVQAAPTLYAVPADNDAPVAVPPNDYTMLSEDKKPEESSSTYILLAVLGILLVSLIIYVVFKRRKNRSRSSYNNNDAENIREIEMLDMKKNSNGKQASNVEIIPLMPKKEQPKIEKGLGDQNKEINANIQPLHAANYPKEETVPLKQNDDSRETASIPENNNNQSPAETDPTQTDELDDNQPSKPTQNGHNGHASDDEVFLPEQVTVKRYSPVYSPETGRVKIKLTETPKPKTPMLVTRSRSNAGAFITTPNLNIRSASANGQ